MKKTTIALTISVILIIVGIAIFLGALISADFDFGKIGTDKTVPINYETEGEYSDIEVKTIVSSVNLALSDGEKTRLEGNTNGNMTYTLTVENGKLTVTEKDTRKWYEHIGFFFGNSEITVYLPSSEFSSLTAKSDTGRISVPSDFTFEYAELRCDTGKIQINSSVTKKLSAVTDTGKIEVSDIRVGELHIETDTGKITVKDIESSGKITAIDNTGNIEFKNTKCVSLSAENDTGSISLTDFLAEKHIELETDTGNVILENADAETLEIDTDTGNVRGNLLTDKIFFTETDTGNVNVPRTTSGGICEISTDTGNINITIG
ncbi:MAG: DUF4097 family beta strand repeat protein [Clostridia bacterium]|nr:DUF4097 family beta strand repeat protein [Clostridia bacterium]